MEIFGVQFIGPVSINQDDIPNEPGIYIINSSNTSTFNQIYIGVSVNLNQRINYDNLSRKIPDNILSKSFTVVYYSKLPDSSIDEINEIEQKLITRFLPKYNFDKLGERNESTKLQTVKRIKRVSRIVYWIASIIALIIAITFLITNNGLFNSRIQPQNSELLFKFKNIESMHQANCLILDSLKYQYNILNIEIDSLTSIPNGINLEIKLNRFVNRLQLLEEKQIKIENIILSNPMKALSIPLLIKDLENFKNSYENDKIHTRNAIDRIYDQNKWFNGLLISMVVSIIATFVN